MPTFLCFLNWTDQGLRTIQDAPKRRALVKGVASRLNITLKDFYITSGDCDVVFTMEAPDADAVSKFAIIVSSQGNVYCRTARAFAESEFDDLMTQVVELRRI
jgi:uncharacterized protein with GYD domain